MKIEIKSNEEIGAFLRKLIESKQHCQSQRDFCRKYIETLGGDPAEKTMIDREAKRLNQILKGDKGIQINDLPIYAHILGITCDDILYAGTKKLVTEGTNTLNNYVVARSKNKEIWNEYISLNGDPIKNLDERNKSIIDYCYEYANTDLIRFLIEKEYISISEDCSSICSSIKNNSYQSGYGHDSGDITTRLKLINLAIKANDVELLKCLRANECFLYHNLRWGFAVEANYSYYGSVSASSIDNQVHNEILTKLHEENIETIASSDENIIDYFFNEKEFFISPKNEDERTAKLVYINANELLKILIIKQNSNVEKILDSLIEYNASTYEKIKEFIRFDIKDQVDFYRSFDPYLNVTPISFFKNRTNIELKLEPNEKRLIAIENRSRKIYDVRNLFQLPKDLKITSSSIKNKVNKLNELAENILNITENENLISNIIVDVVESAKPVEFNINEKIKFKLNTNPEIERNLINKGISKSDIDQVIKGQKDPSLEFIQIFSSVSNISLDYLINNICRIERMYKDIQFRDELYKN